MELITREQAEKEINGWLDTRKIRERKREEKSEEIETLIGAVMDGVLRVDAEGRLIQELAFPIEDEDGQIEFKELTFKNRLNAKELKKYTKGINSSDAFELIRAYTAALTNKSKGEIELLESTDSSLTNTVATFFL